MFVALAWKFLLIVATIQNVFVTCGQENNIASSSCGLYGNHDRWSNKCVDYEWCLYKFYNQNKTWFDAKAICEKENMILAHIPAAQQYSYLYNLMNNTLPALFARPPGSVWVGAYRAEGEEAKWQNECSVVKTSYLSSADNSNEACFLLANSRTLDTESCNSKLPFVCQESSLDIARCFTFKSTVTDVIFEGATYSDFSKEMCYASCVQNDGCVGISYTEQMCQFLKYSSGETQRKGSKYVRDMIRTLDPYEITDGISDLQQVCPSSTPSQETPVITLTEAPSVTPTKTSSITPTQTFSGTNSPVPSTPSNTLMDPSNLESSSPEPPTAMKTTFGSTPPLSTVVTSVNLETTSLPTEAETLSMSCSNCACTKSSSMDQEELEESISKLKEQLSVNPKELSSFKRKLTSASDDRQSAANIGYVGALILCIIPGFVILLDLGRLTREFKQFISRLRNPHRATANVAPLKRT